MRSRHAATGSRRLIHLALALLAGLAVSLSLAYVWLRRDDPDVLLKDWYCFYSSGLAFLEAGAEAAYAGPCIKGQFWLYPPYLLYAYSLSALASPLTFYGFVVVEILAATLVGLYMLSRGLPARRPFETLLLAVVASAPFIATLVMGQHSALLLLGVAAGLWALRADRPVVAGVAFGVLGIKPNWAIVFVLWLLVTRRWKTLASMASVGTVMVLSTIPMGFDVWIAYVTRVPEWVGLLLNTDPGFFYPPQKLITFEAFSRSTVGQLSPLAGTMFWLVLQFLAVMAGLLIWRRSHDVRDQVAAAVLVAIGANLYVEFYDALVLAVPAAIWWSRTGSHSHRVWRFQGWLIGTLWLGFWTWSLWEPGPGFPSLVGGFIALWLACEVYRVLKRDSLAARSVGPAGNRPHDSG